MPRPLVATGTSDPTAVLRGLEAALAGGPALLPVAEGAPALPTPPPAEVRQAVALVVETSGSTGTGKRVALSSEASSPVPPQRTRHSVGPGAGCSRCRRTTSPASTS
ncbi:hypothetical protein [Curtobacterium flaccumfaciens]|uniref:hypothetical protein n=1 Tax=Curtobacterium flaccumfaciens TaxID=2035 RepID=UPI00290575CF|nr:hypothetical protein [Curtobacterium flaccumfaciens]